MSLVKRFESSFGLTRADVTVALFLAATALFGYLYTTFFDARQMDVSRRELLLLQRRYDSTLTARQNMQTAPLRQSIAIVDSAISLRDASGTLPADVIEKLSALDSNSGSSATVTSQAHIEYATAKPLPVRAVNIATAPIAELMTLPGVGQSTARAIIEYRTKQPFRSVADIKNVAGIGDKKFEKMRKYLRLNNAGDSTSK